MPDIPVVDSAGNVGLLSEEDANAAIALGNARPATGDEVLAEKQKAAAERAEQAYQEEFGGVGGAAAAAGIGALRGASFGLSDPAAIEAARALGGDAAAEQTRRAMQGYQKVNPGASLLGEGVGMVAPLLTGAGEAGLLMRGVRGAGAVTRGVEAAGAAAERLGARLVGQGAEGIMGRALQRGTALALRGGVEGAAYGAGSEISQAALADEELTAEKLVAAGSQGFLAGAVAMGALGAGAGAMGAAVEKTTAATRKLLEKADSGKLSELYAKLSSGVSGADVDAIKTLTALGPEGREARRIAAYDHVKIKEEAATAVRESLDEMMGATKCVTDEARGGLKADYVTKAVRRGNEGEVASAAASKFEDVAKSLQEMVGQTETFGNKKLVKNMLKVTEDSAFKIESALAKGDNAEAFVAFDNLKRASQSYTNTLENTIGKVSDPLMRQQQLAVLERFRPISSELRSFLEDSALWGKAAEDQKLINAAWSKQIGASRQFENRLVTKFGRDELNPYLEKRVADPEKIGSYLNGLLDPAKDLTHTAVKDYVSASKEVTEAIAKAYDLPPEKLELVKKAAEQADKFTKTIAKTEDALTLSNQLRTIREAEMGSGVSVVQGLAGGAVFGGPLGAATGAMFGAIAKPGQAIMQLAAMEKLITRVDQKIATGVRKLVSDKVTRVAETAKSLEARGVAIAATRTRSPLRLSNAMFADRIDKLNQLAADPNALNEEVKKRVGWIGDRDSNMGRQASATMFRGIAFLQSKMPKPIGGSVFSGVFSKPRYSEVDQVKFNKYWRATHDPTSVVSDFAKGRATREGVETLKAVYPRMYEQIRESVLDGFAKQRTRPAYSKVVHASLLLGEPLDDSLTPQGIAFLQGAYTQQQPPGTQAKPQSTIRSPKQPLSLAKHAMSETERVARDLGE